MSKVSVVGRLTADPVLRFINSGDAVAALKVAQNDRRYDKASGKWIDGDTIFWKVEAWRGLAEGAADSLKKGDIVLVVGTIKPDNWEKDGQKRENVKIVADEVGVSVRAKKVANGHAAPVEEAIW